MEKTNIHPDLEENKNKSFRKNISLIVLGALAAVSLLTVALVGKQQDIRQRAQLATTTFLETFDGAPLTPEAYDSPRFEIIEGHMWQGYTEGPLVVNTTQHGPDCEKPGTGGEIRHTTATYKDLVFKCRDHVMTHAKADAALIYMTPNHALDLSNGNTATVKWDVSTASLSTRDWISVFVQNWDTQQQKVIDEPIPGQQGNPRNVIQFEQGGGSGPGFESGSGRWHVDYYDNNFQYSNIELGCCAPSVYDVVAMSSETRITFQIDITNKRHVKLWLPQFNHILAEGDISETLNWSKATVTFAHHSYGPEKGANPFTGACCNSDGESNTWHWDNFYLSPAIPFTIIKADHRSSRDGDTYNFASPAPANSLIRFHAFSGDGNVKVSLNDGPLQNATRTSNFLYPEQSASYIINVPQGTTKARFVTTSGNCCEEVMNPTIFSLTVSSTTPIPTPQPTATPTSALSSPTPTKAPTPIITTPTPTGTGCTKTGDLNCDNNVGVQDMSILLSNWNTTNATADINKDGNVTILDLSILLSNWGL